MQVISAQMPLESIPIGDTFDMDSEVYIRISPAGDPPGPIPTGQAWVVRLNDGSMFSHNVGIIVSKRDYHAVPS